MRLTEAQKLKPGEIVVVDGCDLAKIIHVTPRGGILVEVKGGSEQWLPFHRVRHATLDDAIRVMTPHK